MVSAVPQVSRQFGTQSLVGKYMVSTETLLIDLVEKKQNDVRKILTMQNFQERVGQGQANKSSGRLRQSSCRRAVFVSVPM